MHERNENGNDRLVDKQIIAASHTPTFEAKLLNTQLAGENNIDCLHVKEDRM